MLDARQENANLKDIALEVERSFILPNHAAIAEIVENFVHLAGTGNEDIVTALLTYTRHVAVYQAIAAVRARENRTDFRKTMASPIRRGCSS